MAKVFSLVERADVTATWRVAALDGPPKRSGSYVCFLMDEQDRVTTAVMDWVAHRKAFIAPFEQDLNANMGVIAYHEIESPAMLLRSKPN